MGSSNWNTVISGIVYYALAFWFYITGLKATPASQAGLFFNLIPIFSVGGAYLFLGERLAPVQWLGAALILAAVVAIVRRHEIEVEAVPAPRGKLPSLWLRRFYCE